MATTTATKATEAITSTTAKPGHCTIKKCQCAWANISTCETDDGTSCNKECCCQFRLGGRFRQQGPWSLSIHESSSGNTAMIVVIVVLGCVVVAFCGAWNLSLRQKLKLSRVCPVQYLDEGPFDVAVSPAPNPVAHSGEKDNAKTTYVEVASTCSPSPRPSMTNLPSPSSASAGTWDSHPLQVSS
jgi:hypothetical protein